MPCDIEEICTSVGLNVSDLMPKKQEKKRKLTLVETYDFRDALGTLVFQKQRFVDEDGKKTFIQRRIDSETGEWVRNLDGVEKILYNLPMVCSARDSGETIWVVEGEKDVDTLSELGIAATTMPGGAGKWLDIHTETLAGANIVLVADNDDSGKKHAIDVAEKLREAGCVVDLKISRVKNKADVTDHLEAGLSLDDLEVFEPDEESPAEDTFGPLLEKLKEIFSKENVSDQVKISRAELLLSDINPGNQGVKNEGRLVEWSAFVNEVENDSYDWVIPNLLERGERVIVVASEGVGKTMLARQVALCSAAGLHPFKMTNMKPVRTLMVDLENPERIIRRTSKSIYGATLHYGHKETPDAHLLIKPDGIDLLKASDRLMLEDKLEQVRPEIVFLGPVYKSFIDPGGRTSEAIAIEIAKYFDTLREYFKCAMWFEHHAPLGSALASRDLRPFGSAVWSRWPEFGLSLQPDPTSHEGYVYEVKHFRGARDRREWPTRMKRGKIFPFEVLDFLKDD
jgi:5S rRNA maturation endonuclease (ribonuclease M5)